LNLRKSFIEVKGILAKIHLILQYFDDSELIVSDIRMNCLRI